MMMPATVRSLPTDETQETIDFLRRLASMMSGGRNAEMLQAAAGAIETLSRRATAAEALLNEQQDEHARSLEQREVAELAADNLLAELNALKAHLSQSEDQAETEMAALKRELADHEQHAEAEIASLAAAARSRTSRRLKRRSPRCGRSSPRRTRMRKTHRTRSRR